MKQKQQKPEGQQNLSANDRLTSPYPKPLPRVSQESKFLD